MALRDQGRATSRTALRQQVRRLESALGPNSLRVTGDSLGLLRPMDEHAMIAVDSAHSPSEQKEEIRESFVENLRDTIRGLSAVSSQDARALLVSQSWLSKSLPASTMSRLLQVTRPRSQRDPFAGEHRNLETLVLLSQGLPKAAALDRVAKSKKIARRLGQKSIYRTASVLESFATAGERDLPLTPEMSLGQLTKLSMHQRLAYLARLFLDNQMNLVLRATESIIPLLYAESPSSQLHFWTNATVLSTIAEGRDFAAEARRRCESSPGFAFDFSSQRCVSMSLARDRLLAKDIEAAERAANRYLQISHSMGWTCFDYYEIMTQTSSMRGDIVSARRHLDTWIAKVDGEGHSEKRFLHGLRRKLTAAVP